MIRRQRMLISGMATLGVVAALVVLLPTPTQSANQYATPAFTQQWNSTEGVIPNFWGPLSTARDAQIEPYLEGNYNGQTGTRLVQYFDKARMEQTKTATGTVTNGLLTVELKSGMLQTGDNAFQPFSPAAIGIAGDPGQPGPTYASLGGLPEKSLRDTGAVSLRYDNTANTFASGAASTDPQAVFAAYLTDPAGRFGQNVPKAFNDFLQRVPGGYENALGYPITPPFQASVQVGGKANTAVIVQAFQRRVLTYTASNPAAFQVEFGNIGQHYFQWRYALLAATPTATSTPIVTVTAIPTVTKTPRPTATDEPATATPQPTNTPVPPTPVPSNPTPTTVSAATSVNTPDPLPPRAPTAKVAPTSTP